LKGHLAKDLQVDVKYHNRLVANEFCENGIIVQHWVHPDMMRCMWNKFSTGSETFCC